MIKIGLKDQAMKFRIVISSMTDVWLLVRRGMRRIRMNVGVVPSHAT